MRRPYDKYRAFRRVATKQMTTPEITSSAWGRTRDTTDRRAQAPMMSRDRSMEPAAERRR